MAPTAIDFSGVQPFKTIQDNWSPIHPFHDNYITTISFATIAAAFLGTVSLIIKHGFKMPRLHSSMESGELKPSYDHPNEYVKVEDLAESKLFEFEQRERETMAWEEAEAWKKLIEERRKEMEGDLPAIDHELGNGCEWEDPDAEAAEERFHKDTEVGVENAMDILDDEGVFDADVSPAARD
jgi:hypothetical protein